VGKVFLVTLMGDRKTSSIVVLFSCFLLLGSVPSIAFASSSNWVEVTTFTGSGGVHSTSHFTVDYVDWRIRWEVTPGNDSERGTSFNAYVFPESGGPQIEEMHYTIGTEKTTGIKYIYNHMGSFYIVVVTKNIADIKLIIEQNIESIPEFPSWTTLLIAVVAVVAVAVIYKQKLHGTHSRV
jgi:hypothetical protein